MGNLETPVEDRGAPEDDVLLVKVVLFERILHAGKPHQVHYAIAIAEVAHQPLLALAVVEGLETQDAAFQLDKRHTLEQLVGTIYPTPVYVFVGIVFQQLPECLNAQFLAQQFLALRTYSGGKLDVLAQQVVHLQGLAFHQVRVLHLVLHRLHDIVADEERENLVGVWQGSTRTLASDDIAV